MDVPRRQLHGSLDCLGRVFELVIILEIRLQPFENFDRIGNAWLIDIDLLEAPHQGTVLLEILPIFLVGRRTNAPQGARCQRRFQQVGGVHGTARRGTRPDHGVDLVNEHDGAGIGLELLDHLLEALLKIAAIPRARKQRPHVEREHGRTLEHVGNLAVHDASREPLRNGRLSDARISHEQRIVLLPTAEDLDRAIDLGLAADQRINLALARFLVEIDAIGLERIALLLAVIARLRLGFILGAAHRSGFRHAGALGNAVADVIDGVVTRHVLLLQEICGMALALGKDGHQHVRPRHLLPPR